MNSRDGEDGAALGTGVERVGDLGEGERQERHRGRPADAVGLRPVPAQPEAEGDQRERGEHRPLPGDRGRGTARLTRPSRGSRGGRFIMSGADGSSARARAGKTSVTMFSQRICKRPERQRPADQDGDEHGEDLGEVAGEQVVDELAGCWRR